MREVRWNLDRARASQFFERHPEVYFEDELLVVFQVNEEREIAEAGELLAEEPHVFARGPGPDYIRRPAIGKYTRPISVDLLEAMHGIILRARGPADVVTFGKRHRRGMAEGGELVRKIVHVDSAVCAEVVVENEEDVAHAERRL